MTKTQPLTPAKPITWTNGRVTVRLYISDANTYCVETHQGTYRLDEWTRAYTTEAEARTAARHTAKAFAAHVDEQGIARSRQELVALIDAQGRRARRGMGCAAVLADAEAAYDALLSLANRAALDTMRAAFAA